MNSDRPTHVSERLESLLGVMLSDSLASSIALALLLISGASEITHQDEWTNPQIVNILTVMTSGRLSEQATATLIKDERFLQNLRIMLTTQLVASNMLVSPNVIVAICSAIPQMMFHIVEATGCVMTRLDMMALYDKTSEYRSTVVQNAPEIIKCALLDISQLTMS